MITIVIFVWRYSTLRMSNVDLHRVSFQRLKAPYFQGLDIQPKPEQYLDCSLKVVSNTTRKFSFYNTDFKSVDKQLP